MAWRTSKKKDINLFEITQDTPKSQQTNFESKPNPEMNTSTRLKFFMDLGGDGKVNIVDCVAWVLLLVFCCMTGMSLYVFAERLYFSSVLKSGDKLMDYAMPISEVMGTLVTLVYSLAFAYSSTASPWAETTSGRPLQTLQKFLDFNKDGRIGPTDWLCAVTGVTHIFVIFVDFVLFCLGFMATSDVVKLIAVNSRLIIFFLTSSFLLIPPQTAASGRRKSAWHIIMVIADINHDGLFQLVDLLAVVCNSTYALAVLYCYASLVFQPLAQSDVWALISLTSQLNFIMIACFAGLYLSQNPISALTERIVGVYAVFYVSLLLRTVAEILSIDLALKFQAVTALTNGMVVGVTQLVMGAYALRYATVGASKPAELDAFELKRLQNIGGKAGRPVVHGRSGRRSHAPGCSSGPGEGT